MRLERLLARGYRNLPPLTFEPGPNFNVIHGENGSGKSNLLEAISYLGTLRSFRGAKTEDLIGLDAEAAVVEGRFAGDVLPRVGRVELFRRSARKVTLDGKRPRSMAAFHASIQSVLFHPGDLALAAGPPDARRQFLDRILEQVDAAYGAALATYQKALRSRNRLLKTQGVDRRSIGAYDGILASAGALIGQRRARLVDELAPQAADAFLRVAGEELPLVVRYRPRIEPTAEAIRRALEEAYAKDLARGFTADGPHGDELELAVKRTLARHHASQGQHRAIVLALKVAELHVLAERAGHVPLLLLDDVSSELDRTRNRRLFEVLGELGGQVFLTTTHPEFILLERDRLDFRVERGVVTRLSSPT